MTKDETLSLEDALVYLQNADKDEVVGIISRICLERPELGQLLFDTLKENRND